MSDAPPQGMNARRFARAGETSARPGASLLVDRVAALLAVHLPGWRLPRHSELARRYNVSLAELDAAIRELTSRGLLRSLPDGQLFRASPAEYSISLEGIPGLTSRVDPMGSDLTCEGLYVSWRRAPEEIGSALGLAPGDTVCVARYKWTANRKPVAVSMTYLPERLANLVTLARPPAPAPGGPPAGLVPGAEPPDQPTGVEPDPPQASPADALNVLPLLDAPGTGWRHADHPPEGQLARRVGQARALRLEMQPPPPSVARSLRLAIGQPAAMVTVRFDDPVAGTPVAVTVAILRAELFRIVIESAAAPLPEGDDSFSDTWTKVTEEWAP